MPLDTGELTEVSHAGAVDPELLERFAPTLDQGRHIGEALKAAREFRGLSLERLAELTKVRAPYLKAIEEMRLGDLPSLPFTAGYIRAYARALDMDGDLAAARFRNDGPVADARLPEPIGVEAGDGGRRGLVVIIGLALIAAIVLWNVVQRMLPDQPDAPNAPEPSAASTPAVQAPVSAVARSAGAVSLGAPLPAPVESTTPPPYVTPGLAAATAEAAVEGSADSAEAAAKLAAVEAPKPPALPTGPFKAEGAVYGAAANASVVTLKARRPGSLVVRGADDTVYFARQLAAGEAYRVPTLSGLLIDAVEGDTFEVYVAGQGKSVLPAGRISAGKLAARAAP